MEKFEHQQFEEWLLSDESLTSDQSQALKEHLLTCESCQKLLYGLQGIEHKLKSAAVIPPAPGFAERWQIRLGEERLRRGKRQALYFLGFSIAGAVIFLVALAFLVWPVIQSPYPILFALAVRITSAYALVDSATSITSTIFITMMRVIPPVLWLGLAAGVFSLFILWIFILRKVVLQRRSVS